MRRRAPRASPSGCARISASAELRTQRRREKSSRDLTRTAGTATRAGPRRTREGGANPPLPRSCEGGRTRSRPLPERVRQGGKGPGEDDPRARRPVRPRPATRLPRGRSWDSVPIGHHGVASRPRCRASGRRRRASRRGRGHRAADRRRPRRPAIATAFATVIDTRSAPTLVETLSDALADTVGVQVRRFGGLGDFTTVSVRGFSPRQVQVYLDGVPLARADNETVDLSDLPLDTVERVEVYRGATPLRFAQSGPGGVINVVTRQPRQRARHGRERVVRLVRDPQGRPHPQRERRATGTTWSSGTTSAPRATSASRRTTARPRIPPTIARSRASTTTSTWAASPPGWAGVRTTASSFALTSDTFGRDRGYPGRGVPQDPDARRQTVRHLTRVDGIVAPRPGLPLTIEASAWLLYQWQAFEDPLGSGHPADERRARSQPGRRRPAPLPQRDRLAPGSRPPPGRSATRPSARPTRSARAASRPAPSPIARGSAAPSPARTRSSCSAIACRSCPGCAGKATTTRRRPILACRPCSGRAARST